MRSLLLFPDEQIGWRSGATRAGLQCITERAVDVIVSTSPPETAHLIARSLRLRARIPWVADFRDPWSFSHMRPAGPMDRLHAWIEARTLKDADALVTVTEGWSRQFEQLYPRLRHEVIRNGYPAERPARRDPTPSPLFRLVYTGKLDRDDQDPTPLFAGIAEALARREIASDHFRLIFHCYGTSPHRLLGLARSLGMASVFEWGGAISPDAAAETQRDAEALLLLTWYGDVSRVPAKLFDYLGAGRPILCLGPKNGEAASILRQTGQGTCVDSAAECRRALVGWYSTWHARGRVDLHSSPAAVAAHSFSRRADQYDRLLRALVARGRPA